ncbi:carboxymuconolactone decarboxylase family protein [Actinomadura sp. WMMB 499]|uniref:carboxymuconolactone decarboxylase family protein n=1 Tax=Actinomadura sp. WMMB 499 TaxID=1219491 RepID=UPI001244885D|nr:carboxymuconolactone decarboxylase family protein [Actinomadura sp. WMMB 499]QFG22180.1 carboxymuconolactone decarboxylase family protein [Actinomadura sp. WMMB 499]
MTGDAAPRIGPLPADEWAEEHRELLHGNLARADRYLSGAADAPPMPSILGLLARHPRVGAPWLAFSGTLLDGGTLDPRDRELLILRVGRRTRCRYQWDQHVGMARAAGLTAEQVAGVPEGPDAEVWSERDRDILRAADQLVDDHTVDDAAWERLAAHFDERQLLELLFVVGGYVCLAMLLNSVGLEPAGGSGPNSGPVRMPEGDPVQ